MLIVPPVVPGGGRVASLVVETLASRSRVEVRERVHSSGCVATRCPRAHAQSKTLLLRAAEVLCDVFAHVEVGAGAFVSVGPAVRATVCRARAWE